MKKIFFLFLVTLITSGCSSDSNDNISNSNSYNNTQNSSFVSQEISSQETQNVGGNIPASESQSSSQTGSEQTDIQNSFQYSNTYGYYGNLSLNGYLKIEKVICNPDDMCNKTVDYASFIFEENNNKDFKDYLEKNMGNSFLTDKSIGLGCYEKNKDGERIYSINLSNDDEVINTITGDDLKKLLSSNKDNLVTIRITKPVYTGGMGAPECYSHFRSFQVL